MRIYVAHNGKTFELECHGSTRIDVIHNTLEPWTGIAVSDQMLICGDTRFEASKVLQDYNLPNITQADGESMVFLFNRALLLPEAPEPELEEIEPIVVQAPEAPTADSCTHPLDRSPDPLLKALPSYERQFKFHFDNAKALFEASNERFDTSCRLLQEQEVQEMALETATSNMGVYYEHIKKAMDDFMNKFNERYVIHEDQIAYFERDIEKLRQTELPLVLQSNSPMRRTLLDCVKEAALRKWAHDCSVSHSLFKSKVDELQSVFSDLQSSVEELLLYREPSIGVSKLKNQLESDKRFLNEEASILQSLSKDLTTVKKLLEDCTQNKMNPTLRPLDACAALDPMNDCHLSTHLPRMEACDHQLSLLLSKSLESKRATSRHLAIGLRQVAALQSRVRDLRNQLAAFREALAHQLSSFQELRLVRDVASSYASCRVEAARRAYFGRLYRQRAQIAASMLARARDDEVERRAAFLSEHSPKKLPRNLLEAMGLTGNPGTCEINVQDFDSNLIDFGLDLGEKKQWMDGVFGAEMKELEEGITLESSQDDDSGRLRKLELENSWLRAELASAVAKLGFSSDLGQSSNLKQVSGVGLESDAVEEDTQLKKFDEALKEKDEFIAMLAADVSKQKRMVEAYQERIKALEEFQGQRDGREVVESSLEAEPDAQSLPKKDSEIFSEKEAEETAVLEVAREETEILQRIPLKNKVVDIPDERTSEIEAGIEPPKHSAQEAPIDLKGGLPGIPDELTVTSKLLEEAKAKCAELRVSLETKVKQYDTLRSLSVSWRGNIERLLNRCALIGSKDSGVEGLEKIANSTDIPDLRELAEKIVSLGKDRLELSKKSSSAEATIARLKSQLDASSEKIFQLSNAQKVALRSRLAYTRFQLNDLAAFVLDQSERFVGVHQGSAASHYFLSDQSSALFVQSQPSSCRWVVGRIVHIEKRTAGSHGDNPYDLPAGSTYCVVSLAIVPEVLPEVLSEVSRSLSQESAVEGGQSLSRSGQDVVKIGQGLDS